MHDPGTMIGSFPSYAFQERLRSWKWLPRWLIPDTFFTLWHEDPCKRKGRNVRSDDSCGWFMRAGHGDPAVLAKIERAFDFDWDRVHKSDSDGKEYNLGLFLPHGMGFGLPNMTPSGITLNLYLLACHEHFKCNGSSMWRKSRKFVRKNLLEILLFAENPSDSLFTSICRTWDTTSTDPSRWAEERKARIHHFAAIIYGDILRRSRPWYKHPRYHVHHWRLQINDWYRVKRWFTTRCFDCGKRIPLKCVTVEDHNGIHCGCNGCYGTAQVADAVQR